MPVSMESPAGGRAIIGLCTSAVLLLAGSAFAGATPGDRAEADLRQQANQALGLRDSQVVRIEEGLDPGVRFQTAIEIGGAPRVLDLKPYSMQSDDYAVYHSDAEGNLTRVEPGPVNTFRGRVLGETGTGAAGGMTDEGLFLRVLLADEREYWVQPLGSILEDGAGWHVVYEGSDVIDPGGQCGTEALAAEAVHFEPAMEPAMGDCGGGESVYQAEIGVDCDYFYNLRYGNGVEARVNLVLSTMDIQYERDVNIVHVITTIIIRTEQVYSNTSNAESLLVEFRNRWNANHTNIDRDVAHLFTNRFLQSGIIGIAYTGTVCARSSAYGLVRSDFNNTFSCATDLSAHELGHNWSAPHCSCNTWTMNPFITCANRFTSSTRSIIESFRNSRSCLVFGPLAPANDDCADATPVGDGSIPFRTVGSTDDGGNLPAECDEGGGTTMRRDVWYLYTATCDGTATASICDADYNSKLAIYEPGCDGDVLACSDDFCGDSGTRSETSWSVTQGAQYLVRIGGRTQTGCGTLELSCVEGPVCPEDVDGSGDVDFNDILAALAAWGPCPGCDADVNDDDVVDFEDILLILAAWGPC